MNSFSFRKTLALAASLLAISSPWAAERTLLANPAGGTLAAASASDQVLADKLARLRAIAQDKGSTRLIIGVRAAFAPEGELAESQALTQRLDIGNTQSDVLQRLAVITGGNKAATRFETIPFMALEASPAEFDTLAADSDVLSIEEDALRKTTLAESSPLIGATASSAAGHNGSGQVVAILDTGVDKTHPFLSGRVVSEACYSSNNTSYSSTTVCPGGATNSIATGSGVNCGTDCEHGTHVAGIVAGTGASFSGVARGANLIAVQVFSRFNSSYYCDGAASCVMSYTADQIKGLERVYALRSTYSIASVNMSLGGGRYYDQATCDSANSSIKAAIDNLRAVGIATVIASGNETYTNSMGAPGCISSAISVGSTWDAAGLSLSGCEASSTVNKVACYSNSVSFLNLLAPGSAINSSIPGGGYAVYHGTSMATPQVAGAWAVLKQASPGLSVTNALNTFTSTGVSVTDYRNSLVKKRIDLVAALASLVPATTYTLTVNSSGATSVAITATVPTYAGTTPYSKTSIAAGTVITLTAPAAAGGATFSSWSGCDSPSSVTCAVTMNAAKSVTASYSSSQSQTITFGTAPTVVVGGTGRVSASGGASGQPVIFTSTTPSFCTVSGTTVTGVAVGTCTVAANQAGNGSYSAAPQVIQNISISPATTYTLNVNSSGASSVAISAFPTTYAGTTNYSKTSIAAGTAITLTAPATAGGATFGSWSGCDSTASLNCTVTMNTAKSVTASYSNSSASGNLLQNPGFESGATVWTQTGGRSLISSSTSNSSHAGSYYAWLGNTNSAVNTLEQSITIPANTASAKLDFWYRITTSDSLYTVYDTLKVELYSTTGTKLATLQTLSNINSTASWLKSSSVDVSAYKGQTVRLRFTATTDFFLTTDFFIDDVSLTAIVSGSPVSQTITFGTAPAVITGGTGSIIVSASSRLPVTLTSTTASICTVADSSVTGIAAGICTIAANQAGNSSYSTAPQATQNITVSSAPFGTGNIIQNPGFESGGASWTQTSSGGYSLIAMGGVTPAHSGSYYALLGGYDLATDTLEQSVTIPANAVTAKLEFWYQISTQETSCYGCDVLTVQLYPANSSYPSTLKTLSNNDATGGWVKSSTFDLSAYQGQTVRLLFSVSTNSTKNTTFLIDDISLSATVLMSQSISFGDAPSILEGGTGTVSATASSGLPVTLNSTTSRTCTLSGNTVTGISGGTCTITANQAGDTGYSAALPAVQSFTITPCSSIVAPSPPTISSITGGRGSAMINLSPPGANGGTAIVAYAATCAASGQATKTATSPSLTFGVRGLKGGVEYACTATASNAFYTSTDSTAQTVTPLAGGSSIAPILMLLLD
jgi:subtilisin family serine protease